MPLRSSPITRSTPNPQSPAPALPVPPIAPPEIVPLVPADQLPSSPGKFSSYVPTEANNTTEFKHAQSAVISDGISGRHNIVDLPLNAQLPYRQIYAYLSISNAGADYLAKLKIEFWRDNSSVGTLPLAGAGGTTTGDFIPTICTAGGIVTVDSLGLILNDGTQVICQPFRIHNSVDRVTVSVETAIGVTSLFVWLGVASSRER